jgi:hypothetical protein
MRRAGRLFLAVLLAACLGPGGPVHGAAAPDPSPLPQASPTPAPPPSPDPLEEFVPHEKVPADSAVAFPVDI